MLIQAFRQLFSHNANRAIGKPFPDYRPPTEQDRELVLQYEEAITEASKDVARTTVWRVHAVKGHHNVFHVSPGQHSDFIVRLENGECIVERILKDNR